MAATVAANGSAELGIGIVIPNVPMNGLNGPDRLLASYIGKPLIINVWASWCGPCRAEAASLERFAWSDAGRSYTVIGVSTDDHRALAERWLKQSNATLSHFIDRQLVLENLLGAQRIPVTVLVDASGRVVARVQGAREWDSADSLRLIEKAFADFRRARQKG
jgi:thiol-disulfide isomerase/thioredoxin